MWQGAARNLVPYLTARQNVALPRAIGGRTSRVRRDGSPAPGPDELLAIVGAVVGEAGARRFTVLLFSSVHGMAALEGSGHLAEAKWHTTPESLLATLVGLTIGATGRRSEIER